MRQESKIYARKWLRRLVILINLIFLTFADDSKFSNVFFFFFVCGGLVTSRYNLKLKYKPN